MSMQQTFKRAVMPVYEAAMKAVGLDPFSRARFKPRKDIICLGSPGGQWDVPQTLLHPNAICYCAGYGEDISFDLDLIHKFDCQVFAFDPTPRAIEHVKKHAAGETKYHMHEFGLWDEERTLNFYRPQNPAIFPIQPSTCRKRTNILKCLSSRLILSWIIQAIIMSIF